ncbi:MAG: hypothetical protein JRI23_06575 [Deltaproteobacteria bacterium]|jgi:hypothetical protein|nr:hypothetical protein [Deltaproteobacteria bacterium]MBW2531252.1 hypothetical protein [Deltaproteobacteria bacterium]
MVSTGLGTGIGLSAHLAPTSTQWGGVVVVDDKTAIITGKSLNHAIALRTADGGRSWSALKAPAEEAAVRWGAAADGTVVLALGQLGKANTKGAAPPIQSMTLAFAEPADAEMGAARPFFPEGSAPKKATLASDSCTPAAWAGPAASMLMSLGRTKALVGYGAPAGSKLSAETPNLPAEHFLPYPYGRPPSLVSVAGGQLRVRPWPEPGGAVDPSSPVPGIPASAAVEAALVEASRCEAGAWTFQVASAGPAAAYLIGVSPTRALATKLPHADAQLMGCSADAVVIRAVDAKTKQPALVRCTLDGKCAVPKAPPFRYWTDEHEQQLQATATSKGVVATMSAKAGARWGLYLGQSLDQGETFELPRVIGEGSTDRGYIEVAAIVSWPKRVLLLVSADVTGTTRRGWYVIASNDHGTNWGPP